MIALGVLIHSASKSCAELVIRSYSSHRQIEENSVGIASARAGNALGGGLVADRFCQTFSAL